ncbi:hypothetical protein [Fictibacillus sp. BK138]|uniref:hypothetical protein n=1 Tax=Fictibacillus sp. BK138 TaxID=2512121 RepID=UPI00102A8051|nr:hypothetical protein [Fictibacillus sp. BK138]RZT21298.1 hypothetical protein EV282_0355 [Fictibacillus sp. BK138]
MIDTNYIILFMAVIIAMFAGVAVAATRSKSASVEDGGALLFKHLYVYLTLFTTLLLTIGGGISVFTNLADIVSPNPYTVSFNEFKLSRPGEFDVNGNPLPERETEEELLKEYHQAKEDEIAHKKQRAANKIVKSLGFIVIPLPIFIYFSRKLNRKPSQLSG